jgi:hypothetical protein
MMANPAVAGRIFNHAHANRFNSLSFALRHLQALVGIGFATAGLRFGELERTREWRLGL